MEFAFGSGILTGVRTDIVGGSPIRFGALQEVAVEFGGDVKELFSTYQYPIDTARGKTKVTGKAKVAQVRGRMYNDLFFGQTLATGGLRYAYNESAPTLATPYTVANSGSTPLTDQGVFYGANSASTDGNQFVFVSSAPGVGQYTFVPSTGVYTFNTADVGLAVLFNYTYTVATGFNIAIRGDVLMGNTPRFQVTLFERFEGKELILVLYACVSTRLTLPSRIDDYWINDLDFSAFSDASGRVASWNSTE